MDCTVKGIIMLLHNVLVKIYESLKSVSTALTRISHASQEGSKNKALVHT